MANVFGTPITPETLKKMDEFKDKPICRSDLARIAFEQKNAEDKDVKAREYVERFRKQYVVECVLGLIYNASGDTIRMVSYTDRVPAETVTPSPYPILIANGQWGAFLKRGGGAIGYSVFDALNQELQVVYMFYPVDPGRCYTEIKPAYFYKPKEPWQTFQMLLDATQLYTHHAHDRDHKLSSFASIGGTTRSPVFEGIITITNAWSRFDIPVPIKNYLLRDSDGEKESDNPNTVVQPKEGSSVPKLA